MLAIKYIRENLEVVKKAIQDKRSKVDLDKWVSLDDERKKIQQQIDEKRLVQNKNSKEIGTVSAVEKQEKIKAMTEVKKEIKKLENKLKKVKGEWNELLMNIPNITHPDMPVGKDESENVVLRKWGTIPEFDFKVKNHMEIGTSLDLIDVEKAAEVSGARFFYLKNEAVFLQFAIINFVLQTLNKKEVLQKIIDKTGAKVSAKPFIPMLPPVMIRNKVQSSIHRVFGDQTYQFENEEINLVASAEHTMAPYFINETLKESELPVRFIGYSTAFRREAGTYGKDMGGILRTHQFDKLEMESFTDAESGREEQKFIVGIQEYLVQQLKIPYRLVHVCTGDTGKPDFNQFDIECWLPGQNKYRETHTSDYMTDYQMRGINSFYKNKAGKKKLLHTNDATAFAIGRILIAIMENYQQADGSVVIPEVLRKWMPGEIEIIKREK